jgi:hypothetical protein
VHWLEAIYNRRLRHLALDMLSSVDYEEGYWDRCVAAQLTCLTAEARPCQCAGGAFGSRA